MKKFLFGLILVIFAFVFFPKIASADVVNPNYFTAKCNPGEIEVECSSSRASLNSSIIDGCNRYDKNPNYRYLEGTGSTFGGSQKFCFKPVSTTTFIIYHVKSLLPSLLITTVLELLVFFILRLRTKRALISVLVANLFSVVLFYLTTIFLPFSGIPVLLALELVVITFEAIVIKLMIKDIGWGRIMIYSLIANVISAVLGSIILIFLQGIMS